MSANSPNNELLLNMQILKDELEDIFDISYFSAAGDSLILSRAQIYYGQGKLSPECVYIADISEFEKHPVKEKELCIITNGYPKNPGIFSEHSLIITGDCPNWADLYNRTEEIFYKYRKWSEELYYILNHDGGLYELSVSAMNFFQNPLYIHDDKFNILAMPTWVVGMEEPYIDEITGKQTVSEDVIQNFSTNQRYIESLTTQGAQLWPSIYNPHRLLYVNIWSTDQSYLGRFLLLELRSSLKPGTFIMAEYFVNFLSLAIEKNRFKSAGQVSFENILHEYYNGERGDETYLLGRMKLVGWQQHDRYICIKAALGRLESRVLSPERVSSALDVILEQSFSFTEGSSIYTVCNLSKTDFNAESFRREMKGFTQSAHVILSYSNPFTDFCALSEHYRLCDKAMEVGSHINPEESFFPFSDYCLDYILHHFTNEFSTESVASPAVIRLKESDEKKGTNYIETLKCYFSNNCQNNITADMLYIHRSTLEYRLRRIKEIGEINLSDAQTRLYVQISLKLIP